MTIVHPATFAAHAASHLRRFAARAGRSLGAAILARATVTDSYLLEALRAQLRTAREQVATLAAEAVGLLDGDAGTPGIARRVDPRLEAGGRARERSRWHEALEVHVRTGT